MYSSLGDDTCNASPHNWHCVQIWVTLFAHHGHILLKKAIAETLALCLVPSAYSISNFCVDCVVVPRMVSNNQLEFVLV